MTRIGVIALVLISAAAAAPIDPVDDIDPQKFCKICPTVLEFFLDNEGVEDKVFDKVCSKLLKADDQNPMVMVCAAGFVGEMDYIKEKLKENGTTTKQVCNFAHLSIIVLQL
ncbi:hypothetical protein PMAYCL1PPCAC_26265 [Pristionchus mayeri]|uniref:Saposin B-type domain-containing protein n=1 Tax=Pristionchus mayeri TaxID=1317129 RepID=A0AAN5I9G8_9BILA|nr:hypothetical protein PMAYCL1PPCAC_26265 [Pristionchus mayeri]